MIHYSWPQNARARGEDKSVKWKDNAIYFNNYAKVAE